MTLEPGQTVLHYRIIEKLGEGGMGVVWKAVDNTLDREVAIKILPAAMAADSERVARFDREARILASMSHPNIAGIHSVHEVDGTHFLAMELVDGEDLGERLARGPIDTDAAIEIAMQIAEGLAAAHEQGVIHRDLKPGNVKIGPDRQVKVLDLGLAKTLDSAAAMSGNDSAASPTITSLGTVAGVIIGTAAYMSPEQARGRPADRRSDLWAFGCVLYEMLTGQRPFTGDTISDTLAAVLKEDPDWSLLPEETPRGVKRLLRRCLEKDARKRWSDAADARLELEESLTEAPEQASTTAAAAVVKTKPASPVARLAPWLVAALALIVALAAWGLRGSTQEEPRPLLWLTADLGDGLRVEDDQAGNMVISPDGRHVVFSGIDESGQSLLYMRSLDSNDVLPLEGTENAENPLFSPDSAWLGFFADGQLKKAPVAGGPPVEICDGISTTRGATWTSDDRIVFPRHFDTGLWQVSAAGGTATELTPLDESRRERTHRWPSAIPGRPVVLFTVATKDSPEFYDDATIDAVNLETGERKQVFEGASMAFYAPSGHLIFGRGGSLWVVRFDLDTLETSGAPVPVQPNVNGRRNSGAVYASMSGNGTLAYLEGQPETMQREVRWRYFDGRVEPVEAIPVGATLHVAISPDGRKIATATAGATTYDIWVYDLDRNNRVRLTFEGDNTDPCWSPDGRWVYYSSVRDGLGVVYRKPADGAGDEELVWKVDGVTIQVEDISPDGRNLLMSYYGQNKADLYVLDLTDPDAEPQPLLNGPFEEDLARFSPDGRWLAYTTDESGSFEVLVRPASGQGGQWQISSGPGLLPRWSRDGKQLYYRIARSLYAVDVEAGGGDLAFRAGNPRLVFDDLNRSRLASDYDIAPDGRAALIPLPTGGEAPLDRITILANWLDAVERAVPEDD